MKTVLSTSGSTPPLLRITSKTYSIWALICRIWVFMTHHPLTCHASALSLFQASPVQRRTGQSTQVEGLGYLQRGLWGHSVFQWSLMGASGHVCFRSAKWNVPILRSVIKCNTRQGEQWEQRSTLTWENESAAPEIYMYFHRNNMNILYKM